MTLLKPRHMVLLGGMFFAATMGCGLFRPSVEEVRTELARLVDPALDAGLENVKRPEANVSGGSCHEPLFGPASGIRPHLSYSFSFSIIGGEPKAFLDRVEKYWRGEGLEVVIDETEEARILFSGKDGGYNISASIVYETMEARIGGTGPCIDDPEAD